ncbi:hypothetical protein [Nocardiopsis metallicus]|uniref:Uncharacterized protein n=1 Tax=Nocardiopsis metallicus TaxID=179819 RepID=A0A840WKT6_9ACTN|nr:hypothetical protein [Nocardiopsis metallicus]MBB5492277.1 hypothetical protein [Nocardiopsis metallicus]
MDILHPRLDQQLLYRPEPKDVVQDQAAKARFVYRSLRALYQGRARPFLQKGVDELAHRIGVR